jgi:hypothetical protein
MGYLVVDGRVIFKLTLRRRGGMTVRAELMSPR